MASTNTVCCVMFMLFVSLSGVVSATPFNITEILAPFPDFRIFNDLLSRTNVAAMINSRQTITVLALNNRTLSPFTNEPLENMASILMVHVLLDFISIPKLRDLRRAMNVTNLYQTTGVAEGDQGLVLVNRTSGGDIRFWAAAQKEKSSKLLEEVYKTPYNISVLRVSDVIIPPGMVTRYQPHAPPPRGLSPSPSPGPTQEARAPTPAHVPASAPGPHLAPAPAPVPASTDDSSPPPEPDTDDSSPAPGDAGDDEADAPGEGPAASGGHSSNVGVAVGVAAMSCLMAWKIGFPY